MKSFSILKSLLPIRRVIRDSFVPGRLASFDPWRGTLLPFVHPERIRPVCVHHDAQGRSVLTKVHLSFAAKTQMLRFGILDGRHGAKRRLSL